MVGTNKRQIDMNNNLQSWMSKKRNDLKQHPTKAENILYDKLKEEKIKFTFQKFIFTNGIRRIFDFYIPRTIGLRNAIAIEVDGECHNEKDDAIKDANTKRIRRRIDVLRFKNEQIYNNLDQTFSEITKKINQLKSIP